MSVIPNKWSDFKEVVGGELTDRKFEITLHYPLQNIYVDIASSVSQVRVIIDCRPTGVPFYCVVLVGNCERNLK